MANEQLDIVFTAPHPDDLEITMGGTIAKLARMGYRVGMVHMTNGEPTPRGTPETREKEMRAAAKVLGVQVCEMLGLPNRVLMDNPEARYALATALRRYRPRILVGMAGRTPSASPDHYQGQLITEGARFYSQLTKWNERFDGTEPFRIDHLVYRPVRFAAEITHWHTQFVVDISDTIEQKIDALRCYESQFAGERFDGLEHFVRSLAGAEGASAGVRYGEMYALPRLLGITDMVALLGDWGIPSPFKQAASPINAESEGN
ncbi:MAG: PIG-L family deacetylase [Phycisphaerales bacterium]|nr:MAG: PIG-L family deacetylase [Phycisphaerales bacterium]